MPARHNYRCRASAAFALDQLSAGLVRVVGGWTRSHGGEPDIIRCATINALVRRGLAHVDHRGMTAAISQRKENNP